MSHLTPDHFILRQACELDLIDAGSGRLEPLDDLFNSCTFPSLKRAVIYRFVHRPIQPLYDQPRIQAPQLRSLHLRNTFYRWTSSVLNSLILGDPEDPIYTDSIILDNVHLTYMLQTSATSLESLTLSGFLLQEDGDSDDNAIPAIALMRLRYLRIDAEILSGEEDWELYSKVLAAVELPPTAKVVLTSHSTGGDDVHYELGTDEFMDTDANIVKDCLRVKQGCNLDGLVISGRPDPETPLYEEGLAFTFYSDVNGRLPALDRIKDGIDQSQSALVTSFRFMTGPGYDPSLAYLNTLHLFHPAILSQLTAMAYMATFSFEDQLQCRFAFSSLLNASTHVRTFALRDAVLSASEDSRLEDRNPWRSLVHMLGCPILPELECLILYDVVDLRGLPDILGSRMRSLRQVGWPVAKLRELRLHVLLGAHDEASSGGGGLDVPVMLPPTLYEYAESVVLYKH
ncbi:unnamed protein product [Peniophora sp. CBMAI 1063]|nr:unnamed protein product [Peniophora sp. CBMAI 1063]